MPDPSQNIKPVSVAFSEDIVKESENSRGFFKSFIKAIRPKNSDSLKESLEELLEEHEEEGESINLEEKQMLSNILAFGDLRVAEVMTPRAYIVAVEDKINIDELKNAVVEKQHTRIPVYRNNLDDIKGFIHVKDLFPYFAGDKPFVIREILRTILFVPPSMHIIDLLAKMRSSRAHIALVIDEYGGTSGLVTMEDLMERIVGEIKDEHDDSENEYEFLQVGSFAYEVSAAMPISMLEEKIAAKISSDEEKEDFDTVGGMLFTLLGRVPEKAEKILHPSGWKFEIMEADSRRIKKVLLRKEVPNDPAATT